MAEKSLIGYVIERPSIGRNSLHRNNIHFSIPLQYLKLAGYGRAAYLDIRRGGLSAR